MREKSSRETRAWAALIAVIALAAFFRLHDLDRAPPGLFLDEAINGLDARAIAAGENLPVYLIGHGGQSARGREPLYCYLMAGVFVLLGPSVSALRLTSALIGIATVVGLFILVRRIWGVRVAFFAGALLAVSRWHTTFSRLGMRAILVPLWIVLVLLAVESYLRAPTKRRALVCGALLGVGFYTYPAYWVVPVALVVALLPMVVSRETSRAAWRQSFWLLLAAGLTLLPLALFALGHPEQFMGRALETWQPDFRDATMRLLLMLHFRGDSIVQHNIPGRPLLDPLSGLLFVIGLIWSIRTWRRDTIPKWVVLLFWLTPLFPSIVTESPPHAMRSLGAVPAVSVVAALGLEALYRQSRRLRASRRAAGALAGLALVAVSIWSYYDFFRIWANLPEVASRFAADVPRFVDFLADESSDADIYASPYLVHSPNIAFLAAERRLTIHLLNGPEDVMASEREGRDRVFAGESPPIHAVLDRLYPEREQLTSFSVYDRSEGRVDRVPKEDLRVSLTVEEEEWSRELLEESRRAFETATEAW